MSQAEVKSNTRSKSSNGSPLVKGGKLEADVTTRGDIMACKCGYGCGSNLVLKLPRLVWGAANGGWSRA
jgi:hypothetical protein